LKSFFVGCEGGGSDLCASRLTSTLRPTLRRGIGDESLVLAVVGGIFLNSFLAATCLKFALGVVSIENDEHQELSCVMFYC